MTREDATACLETALPPEFSGVVSVSGRVGPAGPRSAGRRGTAAATRPVTVARGLAYRPERVPNRPGTRFGIASGTKGFTAAAVLRLILGKEQAGAWPAAPAPTDNRPPLALSSCLADLLPGRFPAFDPSITVRHLLAHTSGIPDYCDEEAGCDFEALWRERPVYAFTSPSDFVPLFAGLPAKFAPGGRFGYSNSGYIVLGLILEEVTGMPYHEAVRTLVFDPFGMRDAGFFRPDALPGRCALGYIAAEDGVRSNVFSVPALGGPDGGAFVSATDMHRFWANARHHPIGSLFAGPGIDTGSPRGHRYALGFWIATRWDTEPFVFLTGSDPGVSFLSGCCPTDGRCFVILSNTEIDLRPVAETALALARELG